MLHILVPKRQDCFVSKREREKVCVGIGRKGCLVCEDGLDKVWERIVLVYAGSKRKEIWKSSIPT